MERFKFIKSFLPHHMKRQVKELFISTTLVNLALALVMIFEPIYLYQIGYSLQKIMFFYLIAYFLYFILMPLGGKFARRKGYEIGMLIGTFLFIAYYTGLFLIGQHDWLFYVAPIFLALQKTFYWPAYHADFARFSDATEEGREVSAMNVASSLVYIVGPAAAGFIIFTWGYGTLFVIASILFVGSNISTLATKEKFTPRDFSYKKVYSNLFSKKNRSDFFAYLGYGEELILMVVWPVFISIIIIDVFNLGLIVALATLITTLVTLYIGKLSDSRNKRKILSLGSTFYSLAWFIRIFITNTVGVFFVDTMSKLGKNTISIPLMAITYEKAKDVRQSERSHIMNSIVFFEMSLVAGKLVAILAIYLAMFFITDEVFAFKLTFILAGSMSLLYMLL
ncbi:MFS transporter [Candidatus Parcubacteria bacterium]|jgi:MFS family permease|nr:MFS transporter [Candidatus Parcubacteria bacterium]